MADTKLSNLTSLAAPTRDDLLYVVDDPAGTPTHYKATVSAVIGGPALYVAAVDAPAASIKGADYVCDGTADDVQILAALAALPTGGGTVRLSEGAFTLAAGITLPAKAVQLVGADLGARTLARAASPMATILNFAGAAAANCIAFSNDSMPQMIGGFEIVGDAVNTDFGIYVGASSAFKTARSVGISGVVVAGVEGITGNSQNVFEHVCTEDLDSGFHMYGVANRYLCCQASRSAALGMGGVGGFRTNESGSVYVSCVAQRYTAGFFVGNYANGVTLLGCYGELNSVDALVTGGVGTEPVGTTLIGFYTTGAVHVTEGAIRVSRAFGTTIQGATILAPVSNVGIEIAAVAATVKIDGGFTDATTPVSDAGGANVDVRGIYSYLAENKGAAAGVADGGTIAHGLSATPTVALVSGTVAAEMVTVTALGAANITVAIKDDAAGPGTNQTVYWRAYV